MGSEDAKIEWSKPKGKTCFFKVTLGECSHNFRVTDSGEVFKVLDESVDVHKYKGYSPHKSYHSVVLNMKGRYKRLYVHRLVAQAFISNPEKLEQVNHRNGIKSDNNVSNLEWSSLKQNIRHAIRNGLTKNRAVNFKQYRHIISNYYCKGDLAKDLAKEYKVSESSIIQMVSGNTYRDFYDEIVAWPKFCESAKKQLKSKHEKSNNKSKYGY